MDPRYTLSAGARIGRLVLEELVESTKQNQKKRWLCRCSCGNRKIVPERYLRDGRVKSCGCLARDILSGCRKKDCRYYSESGCSYFMVTGHARLATHLGEDGSTNPHLLNNPCREYDPGENPLRRLQPFTINNDLK